MHTAQEEVVGYAHCRDARCPGYNQVEVPAVKEERFETFGDNGGDGVFMHMVERSHVTFKPANEEDIPCPACHQPREVTGDPRPQYQSLSGHDPMGLIHNAPFDPSVRNTEADAQIAELQATVARLAAIVEKEE